MTEKKDDPEIGGGGAAEIDNNTNNGGGIGPTGKWKRGLCDFLDVIVCTPLCCMGVCCSTMLLGQIMTRLGLDWMAGPNAAAAAGTFSIVTLLFFGYFAGCIVLFGIIFTPCFLAWILLIYTRTRYEFRQRFQIPPDYGDCCDGVPEDCLCGVFCSCCSTIQMARHTHDEERYPYKFDAPDGLPPGAPALYDDRAVDIEYE